LEIVNLLEKITVYSREDLVKYLTVEECRSKEVYKYSNPGVLWTSNFDEDKFYTLTNVLLYKGFIKESRELLLEPSPLERLLNDRSTGKKQIKVTWNLKKEKGK
jgi:hypothetical protein